MLRSLGKSFGHTFFSSIGNIEGDQRVAKIGGNEAMESKANNCRRASREADEVIMIYWITTLDNNIQVAIIQ